MDSLLKYLLALVLLWTLSASAKTLHDPVPPLEQQLLEHIEATSGKERILALGLYQERTGANILTQEQLAHLFVELDRTAATDGEFKRFVDFYKRVSPTFFIPEKNRESTHRKMLSLYQDTATYYLSTGDHLLAGITFVHMGFDQFMLESYGNAIESMLQGYELLKKVGFENNPLSPKYLHDMALVFLFFGENEKVVELMEASADIVPIDINRDIQRFNNLGIAYLELGNKDKAERAFLKIIERAELHKVDIWISLALSKIARLRLEEKKFDTALELYEKAFALIKEKDNPREYAENVLKRAKIHILMGNPEQAREYFEKVQSVIFEYSNYFGEKQQFEKYFALYYEVGQLYYKTVRDYERAYRYSDSLHTITRSQDSVYSVLRVHLAREKLQVEKAQSEKEHIRTRMWAGGIMALLVITVLILLFWLNRIRRAKEKEAHLYREKLMEKEKQHLNNELERLRATLEGHLKKIAENNKIIKQYQNEKEETDHTIDIHNLKILTKEHWEDFIKDFRRVHPRFYKKVVRQWPNLTPSELRMVLLLKLGISHKELPSVLGTSQVNIRVTLHRLRQKMAENTQPMKDKELLVFASSL